MTFREAFHGKRPVRTGPMIIGLAAGFWCVLNMPPAATPAAAGIFVPAGAILLAEDLLRLWEWIRSRRRKTC